MPKFIPVHILAPVLPTDDLLSEGRFESFLHELQTNKVKIAKELDLSEAEIDALISSVDSAEKLLFHQWVNSNYRLKNLLLNDKLDIFEDRQGITKHQLFQKFQEFISPFLLDRLLSLPVVHIEQRSAAMSYVCLLDNDNRILAENQLYRPIRDRLEELRNSIRSFENEQQLIDQITPLCDDKYVQLVNMLSKSSYALKLLYVDTMLSSLRSKACTIRFANWVLKEMEKVQLNKEHQHKISDVRSDLKKGRLVVKNHAKGKTPIRLKDILLATFIFLIASSVFYILYYKPFSSIQEQEFEDGSSFKEFTIDERRMIDSLIQTMETQEDNEKLAIDPGIINGGGVSLSIRKPFINNKMEAIYSDLTKDAKLKNNYILDTCGGEQIPFERIQGVKDPSGRKGLVSAVFRNESEYDILIYIGENKKNGVVTSTFLKKNTTAVLPLNYGDALMIVAGNQYAQFSSPQGASQEELPSGLFKHHFCQTDNAYEETINMGYRYTDKSRSKTKFMVTGSKGSYVKLIDLFGVLSDY